MSCMDVKQPAHNLIWASGKGTATGKETDGIDVRLTEGLPAHLFSDIPGLGLTVVASTETNSLVSGGQAHDVSSVSS